MNPATPEKKPTKPGPPPLSSRKKKLTISTVMTPPIRGGEHKTHGINIGGGAIRDDWKLPGKYHYTIQGRDKKYVAKIESSLIERCDNSHERKFEGNLENGSAKELDKDQFIRALTRKVREHGHESFLPLKKQVERYMTCSRTITCLRWQRLLIHMINVYIQLSRGVLVMNKSNAKTLNCRV
jgi:hypothetical protein